MKNKPCAIIFFLLLLQCIFFLNSVNGAISAQPASIITCDDSYVYSGMGHDYNFGYVESVYLDDTSDILMAYLKFNLTNIDPIKSAILNLTKREITYSTPPNVSIHIVTGGDWFEENITWDNKPVMGDVNITFPVTFDDEFWEINITSIVLDWQSGKLANYGLVLEAEGQGLLLAIWSKESTEGEHTKPHLIFTYSPPTPEIGSNTSFIILITLILTICFLVRYHNE